jgi:hypothetical protein
LSSFYLDFVTELVLLAELTFFEELESFVALDFVSLFVLEAVALDFVSLFVLEAVALDFVSLFVLEAVALDFVSLLFLVSAIFEEVFAVMLLSAFDVLLLFFVSFARLEFNYGVENLEG